MKNLNKLSKLMIGLVAVSISLMSCNKDESTEPAQPYVGKWQSAVYPSLSLTGDPISEQMTFTFTANSFEDKIFQGEIGGVLKFASAIKGSIIDPTETAMNVEINQMSIMEGIYINKETDPEIFAKTWTATLGNLLFEDFSAEFLIDGDNMKLILPVKYQGMTIKDTLNLNRIN